MPKNLFDTTPVARQVPFDNSTNGFISTDTQSAIEEVSNNVEVSASPGFTWGRSGNSPNNTYLLNDGVPSNVTGRVVFLTDALISKIFTATQNTDTYDLSIYTHDGDGINLTLLTTVSVSASRYAEFSVSISVAKNKQLALRITSGSATNIVAGIIISGSVV